MAPQAASLVLPLYGNHYRISGNFINVTSEICQSIMLILQAKDIEYCHISAQKSTEVDFLAGLKYHGHLFIKVKSYTLNHLDNAILRCRKLLEHNPSILLPIILFEPTGYSIWFEHKSIQRLKASHSASPEGKATSHNTQKIPLK